MGNMNRGYLGSLSVSSAAFVAGLYFIAPGVLCIISGKKQGRAVLGATLTTNIMGMILSISSVITSALFWKSLEEECGSFGSNCSDMKVTIRVTVATTIIFCLATIVSFIGSIYGCGTTCCTEQNYALVFNEPDEAVVMVTATQSNATNGPSLSGDNPPAYNDHFGTPGNNQNDSINQGPQSLVNV
ncbi:uncharacterized protein LOC114526379 [Dendronephthya gigantea]|uniref:uncharacterized protein LOC114526379 n=1 Tax=Dendronephthya gigantea TaxID=151771 RepID=UPI00106D5FD6|nr:uncharacterized protein LOC114526379 [Dendronephthya gigantea]